MIEKNSKKFEPSKADLKNIKDKYQDKNGNITLLWSKSRATPNPHLLVKGTEFEKTLEYPQSFQIATEYQVRNEDGLKDYYRYFETKTRGDKDRPDIYLPATLYFSNTKIVSDVELQWFLIYCCPLIENGVAGLKEAKADKDYRPWFRIEMIEAEAKQRVLGMRLKNEVERMIIDDLPENHLRDLAAMYRIANPDSESLDRVRELLLEIVSMPVPGDATKKYKEFKERMESIDEPKKNDDITATVGRGLEQGVLSFKNVTQSWAVVDDKGDVAVGLCRVNSSHLAQKREVLERHLLSNKKDLIALKKAIEYSLDEKDGSSKSKKPPKQTKDKK